MTRKIEPLVYQFLKDLAANNNKPWFDAHREYYQQARNAFLSFCESFLETVGEIDPTIGPLDTKGTVYRINRDVRFSPDKSPYKRHFCIFAAPGGKNSRLPGYYLHIQPDYNIFGSGNYGLDAEELKRLRTEICNFPEELAAIVESDAFRARLSLSDDEKLKTVPRGYEIEPRYADYLKHKSLSAFRTYTDEEVMQDNFLDILKADMELARPLNAFFRRALETEAEDVDF